MLAISIDGACRRNGKPDCIASGGVYIEHMYEDRKQIISAFEKGSTNQRGELLALTLALEYILKEQQSAIIITDSEYLFNTMTKEWFTGWESRGWLTSAGEPVKNADMWKNIKALYEQCKGLDINLYHIKGHCITIGAVTADKILTLDPTGQTLKRALYCKYDETCKTPKYEKIARANQLSIRNNGFELNDETLRNFIVMNMMADIIATKCVDEADTNS